jgi:hypothetical protein
MDDNSHDLKYSTLNPLKTCAEGLLANLLTLLDYKPEQIQDFWEMCNLPIDLLCMNLGKLNVPQRVMSKDGKINTLKKLLWIIQTKFGFTTTKPLKVNKFTYVNETFKILSQFKFPMLISVAAKDHHYKHVIVVWNKMIIDYKRNELIELTKDNLSEVCGNFNHFCKVDSCYGIFPSRDVRQNYTKVTDWGDNDYNSGLKKRYFV